MQKIIFEYQIETQTSLDHKYEIKYQPSKVAVDVKFWIIWGDDALGCHLYRRQWRFSGEMLYV